MDLPADPLALSFDIYQRYRQVADLVQAIAPPRPLRLVDVGGEFAYLQRFLPHASVTVVDPGLPGLAARLPGFVAGDGARLPFRTGSFDVAVSIDSLEHVAPAERPAYLGELRRVAALGVIVAAPFDSDQVRDAERCVNELYQALFGHPHQWLDEHERQGLPSLGDTQDFFRASGDHVRTVPNGYLPRWIVMLTAQVTSTLGEPERVAYQRLCRYYNEHLYPQDGVTPAYRHVVLAARTAPAAPARPDGERRPGPLDAASADLATLLSTLTRTLSRHSTALRDVSAEAERLRARVSALEGHLRALVGSPAWQLMESARSFAARVAPPATHRRRILRGMVQRFQRFLS